MKTFLLISPKNRTVYNFRGELIKKIISHGYRVVVTGPNLIDVDKIRALGAEFKEIPMNKNGTSVRNDLRYCKALSTLMKEIKPDCVLGYTIKPVVYGALAAKKNKVKNVNCLITGGGYTFTSKTFKAKVLGSVVRILYRKAFKSARTVIFQNGDDRTEFINKKLVKKNKTYVVNGSGVDLEKFKGGSYPDKITFFMLSRLLKSKGVEEYLKAAEIVKKQYPSTRFMLLGKYETSMQDAVSKDLVERYIADGVVERFDETSDVAQYYNQCSVYVLPSYREGTPRTVLEAMAMGRPIITTDTNGCRDTVKDGSSGYLVKAKNVQQLADKMMEFVKNPNLVSEFGSASHAYCEEKYDVNKVNKDMLSIMNIEED